MDTSLYWLAAIAAVGLVAMLILLVLVAAPRWGMTASLFRRAVIRVPTLRGRLMIGLFLIGAIPVMTLPPILMLENARARQLELGEQLRLDASDLAHGLMRSVQKQIAGVDALAAHINSLEEIDGTSLGDWLLRHHAANPEFVSMWVARPDGEVVTATAFLEGDHQPWSGPLAGVSLLKFFPAAIEHEGLYVSPVIKGVAPRHDPMILISAPLFAEGTESWGFLQAQLNMRRVYRNIVSFESTPGRVLLLADRQNRVMVVYPEGGLDRFDSLSGHSLIYAMERAHGEAYPFEGLIEDAETPAKYLAVHRSMDNGWQVFAIATLSGTKNQALIFMALSLLWVCFVTYLAMTLARFYGGIIGEPLQTLDRSLDLFDAEHTLKMIPMAPEDAPIEIIQVFNRVRRSMKKSRDSYRNMLKAVNEGEELRRKLQLESKAKASRTAPDGAPKSKSAPGAKGLNKAARPAASAEYEGRWDSATELSGTEVFEEFFGEAWSLGCADARPLSLLLFSIGLERVRAADTDNDFDAAIFGSTGKVLRRMAGRELDLVARVAADQYVLVLPDTDLYGALIVAERAREALDVVLKACPGGKDLEPNVAVASVVPNPDGDAPAVLKVVRRLLTAIEKKAGSRIAYMDESLKLNVLEVGEAVPTGPRERAKDNVDERAGKVPQKSRRADPKPEAKKDAKPVRSKPTPSESSHADFAKMELELEKTMTLIRGQPEPEPSGFQPYAPAEDEEQELEKTMTSTPNRPEPAFADDETMRSTGMADQDT